LSDLSGQGAARQRRTAGRQRCQTHSFPIQSPKTNRFCDASFSSGVAARIPSFRDTMLKLLRAGSLPILLAFLSALLEARAGEPFPFGSELMLDAAPLLGSKRVPMIEIEENGAVSIDLWCASVRAQATVGDDSITIVSGDTQTNEQCEPERQALDANLLAELAQVTNWRRNGEVIELLGATPLRFRLMTN
jgi:META domain